jgi:hypothetical protein
MRHAHALCILAVPLIALACSSARSSTPGAAPDPDAGASSSSSSSSGGFDASTLNDSAPVDVANDGAASSGDDAPALTCGPAPARFTLLTGADAGLVRDNETLLVWMSNSVGAGEPPQTQSDAATYCTNRGMRLPTEAEARALAASYAPCAFGQWSTWTSTTVGAAGSGDAWVVDYLGDTSPQLADNFPSAVLCARDSGG